VNGRILLGSQAIKRLEQLKTPCYVRPLDSCGLKFTDVYKGQQKAKLGDKEWVNVNVHGLIIPSLREPILQRPMKAAV
jgi:hypothetical protein